MDNKRTVVLETENGDMKVILKRCFTIIYVDASLVETN